MNVASLELCKELFKVSEWRGTYFVYDERAEVVPPLEHEHQNYTCPAYDLGYLLRKLPNTRLKHSIIIGDRHVYFAEQMIGDSPEHTFGTGADTPEDAACKLAIELFKQDVLTKEQSHV